MSVPPNPILERFAERMPIPVMTRGVLQGVRWQLLAERQHRLQELRAASAAALPGKSVAVFSLELFTDMLPL